MKKKTIKAKRKASKQVARSPYSMDYDWWMTIPTGRIEEPGVLSFIFRVTVIVVPITTIAILFE